MPDGSHTVVTYDDLTQDLEEIIAGLYTAFGFHISHAYDQALKEEVKKARQYTSHHRCSLQQMGLTQKRIATEYQDVYARFGFETEIAGST